MTRFLLIAVATVALATASAQAITIDGNPNDWAGLLKSDRTADGLASSYVEILRYGVTVQNNNLYVAMETAHSADWYDNYNLFMSVFIDADNSTATQLGHFTTDYIPLHGEGVDINLEWGRLANEGIAAGNTADPDYNYWGHNGDLWQIDGNGVPGAIGWHADSGSTLEHGFFEFGAPLSSITNRIAALTSPFNITPGSVWNIRMGAQVGASGGGVSGYDGCDMPGDADWNNTTNATDLNTVLSYYGQTGTSWEQGNFDQSSGTDATDLNTVLSYYGQTNNVVVGGSVMVSTVPEPSSIAMVAALAAMLAGWVMRQRVRS